MEHQNKYEEMLKLGYPVIEIDKIDIPKERARATFTPEQDKELRASISENGFTIPILLKPKENGKFDLVDGEHRTIILREWGWPKIMYVSTGLDEKRAVVLNILANTARGTQNPIDISESLNRAKEAGATTEELAAATGHTQDWVEFYLLLKKLPKVYYNALKDLHLAVGAVKEAFRLPTPEDIDAILGAALLHKWPVSTIKIAVDNRLDELKLARQKAEILGEPSPSPSIKPEDLIHQANILINLNKVKRGDTWMKVICNPCLDLLRYLLDVFGDSKTALQETYKALKEYKERQDYERLKTKFEPEIKKEESPSSPKSGFPGPTSG